MNFIRKILKEVRKTINSEYYARIEDEKLEKRKYSGGLIAEIKPASPTEGELYSDSIEELAAIYEKNGANAISVLTEPTFFKGNLRNITIAKKTTNLPILMKDFIVSEKQVLAGKNAGADIILLIYGISPPKLIDYVHLLGLEVLLEVHTLAEFKRAKRTKADFIGINNRNLKNMEVDVQNTIRILGSEKSDGIVISESGIKTKGDVELLKKSGVKGILVGTNLLKAKNIGEMMKELRF